MRAWWHETWVSVGLVAVFVAFWCGVWWLIRDAMSVSSLYRLQASQIDVPQIPDWVDPPFVEEVLSRAGLECDIDGGTSLLERGLAKRLEDAFAAHPWVKGVHRVQLTYPGGAQVSLTYRQPVAEVVVASKTGADTRVPIDDTGVVLRTDQTLPPDSIFVIRGITSLPSGNAGDRWGDDAVTAAAFLAAFLHDVRDTLGLAIIEVQQLKYHLITRGGAVIVWGTFDPAEHTTNTTRKKRLQDTATQYGSLDQIPIIHQPFALE